MSFDPVSYLLGTKAGGGGGVTVEPLSVTANGEYTASGKAYSPVTVNVQPPEPLYTITGRMYAKNMEIPIAYNNFAEAYANAVYLENVVVFPKTNVYESGGAKAFYSCSALETAVVTAFSSPGTQMFRNCPALKTVQFGDVGLPIDSIGAECFYSSNNVGLTITIYVADETPIPLSGSPWNASQATFIYRSATTGEVRTV